ncbi:MAG: hypothetical protein ABIP51_02645 [Bacteroidia bacterium]
MKFLNFSYLFGILCVLLFTTCKNKLDINAPYKEIPTIYAVLCPQERLQIIRINKVFLGEGNANDMAQVADSINYPAGALTVTLERFLNGVQVPAGPTGNIGTITFQDSIVQASPGAFNSTQRVYVYHDTLFRTGQYVLKVKHSDGSGKVFTARANAIDSVNKGLNQANTYAPFVSPYYPVPPGSVPNIAPLIAAAYIDYSNPNGTYSPKFFPNEAAIYTMTLRFHFFDSLFDGSKVYRYVDYNFGNQYIKDLRTFASTKVFAFDFKGADLFNSIGYALSKMNLDNNIRGRKMYKLQAIAYSSTQDYADYLQFSAPSLSIAQSKPIYSNFDNRDAMGIFSFRTRHSIFKELSTSTVSQFSYNPKTCMYKFYTAGLTLAGC